MKNTTILFLSEPTIIFQAASLQQQAADTILSSHVCIVFLAANQCSRLLMSGSSSLQPLLDFGKYLKFTYQHFSTESSKHVPVDFCKHGVIVVVLIALGTSFNLFSTLYGQESLTKAKVKRLQVIKTGSYFIGYKATTHFCRILSNDIPCQLNFSLKPNYLVFTQKLQERVLTFCY